MNARLNKCLVSVALIAVLALTVLPTAYAQDGPKPEAVGLRPDAPPYALHGPYWVGTQDFVIDEGGERPLTVTVWYPALNPDGAEESIAYHMEIQAKLTFELPDWYESIILGHALADASPDIAGGPYPLVIFSHGFGAHRHTYAYLTEHLASYGFVVIVPDHLEVWNPEMSELGESAFERPLDIQQVIAFAGTLAASDGELAGLVDMNQIGVAGHSYGGYTALTAGGARFDTAAFNARCAEAAPGTEFATVFCPIIMPAEADLAALVGLDEVPEGYWPSWGDPRVRTVVSLAGSPLIQEDGLKEVTVPLLAMVGSLDTAGQGAEATEFIYQQVGSATKAQVIFANAEHYIFQWSCADAVGLADLGFFPVCSDSVWEMSRAHDLINHFTTAFLLATLKDDADAAAALSPDAVSFPGITYETQGF